MIGNQMEIGTTVFDVDSDTVTLTVDVDLARFVSRAVS